MQNMKPHCIRSIEKLLGDEKLLETQRKTLVANDRLNKLARACVPQQQMQVAYEMA